MLVDLANLEFNLMVSFPAYQQKQYSFTYYVNLLHFENCQSALWHFYYLKKLDCLYLSYFDSFERLTNQYFYVD